MEGRAIVGELAGTRLGRVPANTLAYDEWKAAHPRGQVLSRETGHSRPYGRNPYAAYDRPESIPFLFQGTLDRRRPPKEVVIGVTVGGAPRAYPWPVVARHGVVHDTVGTEPLVIFYRPGALSALDDEEMQRSRAVGATGVFSPVLDGRILTFEAAPEGFRDRQTGTLWNLLGLAVNGPLAGRRLTPIPHVDAFWFAWAAFHPATTIYAGP
jgi:hypothetical protein